MTEAPNTSLPEMAWRREMLGMPAIKEASRGVIATSRMLDAVQEELTKSPAPWRSHAKARALATSGIVQ